MTVLRQAAKKFLRAYNAWADTPALMPSGEMLEAIAGLEQALACTESISTDELLSRLQPGQRLELRVLATRASRPNCSAMVNAGPFEAVLGMDGWPIGETAFGHPAAALRAALLQLPEPTQPPPRKGA